MLTKRPRHAAMTTALVVAMILFAFPQSGAAQEGATTGSIVGQVVTSGGTPAEGARVTVTNTERGTTKETVVDDNGRFVVAFLPPGPYRIEAEGLGQTVTEAGPLRVTVGQRSTVTLQLQPVDVGEVGVEVARDELADTEAGVVDLVSEEQVSTLPTAGRDFTDFINLSGLVSPQPGSTTGGQFSIGGARTSLTNLQIDGADANNAFFGENRGSSRVPFTFSLESIREFQIITNGYDVEYGRFSGGVVNAVTKSGTNEFEGSAHLFWRDEAVTSDNFDGTPPANFQAFQFGGSLSGPIVEDQLHFFVSGDFQLWDQPTFALDPGRANLPPSTVQEFRDILRDDYGFGQDFIDENFGTFTETQDQANVFGRLDWSPSEDHTLTLRANYSDFNNRNDGLAENGTSVLTSGSTFKDRSLSVVGEWNSQFSRSLYNTLRVQYAKEDRPRPGNSTLPNMQISGVETEDGGTTTLSMGGEFFGITFLNRLEEEKIQVTDNLTLQAGDHTFKVGTDNIFTNTFNRFWLDGNGYFQFNNGLEGVQNKSPAFFLRAVKDLDNPGEPPVTTFDTQEWSVYVQDEWRTTDKLRLTLGLRWDYTNWVDEGEPLAEADVRSAVNSLGVSPTTVPDDKDNFGPRVSFNYDLQGDESSILRGGAGVFTARTPTVYHSNITLANPRPLKFVFCLLPSTEGYRNWDRPEDIPITAEEIGAAFCDPDLPELSVWDENYEDPTTYKANLSYQQQFGNRWRTEVEAIYSYSTNLYGAANLNQPESPFFTTQEGRPVWVPEQENYPLNVDLSTALRNEGVRALYQLVSNGEARAWNFRAKLSGYPTDNLRLGANYALNLAYDNNASQGGGTSFGLLFNTPTAADPNFVGDPGDTELGAWGPSRTERRHVFVTNFTWQLPEGFTVAGIYRAQAGNPFTPGVQGDLNGDGNAQNDRPFLPNPENPGAAGYVFETSEDLARYSELLEEHSCLEEAVGGIVSRNTCRNPWWHSLDLKVKKRFTAGSQNFEIVADLFNVLDGLGLDAGEFVFLEDELFQVESYDPDTDQLTVSTGDFGRRIPVGFEPLQFQAQVGVRYHF